MRDSEVSTFGRRSAGTASEAAPDLAAYQDGLDFDLDRIKQRILDVGMSVLEEMVTIGKYLIWVKGTIGHGRFVAWVGELGMSRQRSSEFMRVAQRVVESECPLARSFLEAVSGDSKKKMLALLDVSDEEMKEVMARKSFLGRKLDDVATMGYRQLRAALRQSRGQNAALRGTLRAEQAKSQGLAAENRWLREGEDAQPPLIRLEAQFARAIRVLGVLERMALEYAEEYGDQGLSKAPVRDAVQAFGCTLSQKVTGIVHVLTPDGLSDARFHVSRLLM